MEDILKKDGLSFELLEALSYRSNLGIRLKKNLHYFDKQELFDELERINEWYDMCSQLQGISIDYRIKSIQSAMLKYERYYPDHQTAKVFNDLLEFRTLCDTYYDRQLNNWLHKYVYKRKYKDQVGYRLRQAYESGKIKNESEFKEVLGNVLSDSEEIR